MTSHSDPYFQLSNTTTADRIRKVLRFLKGHKISQAMVGDRIHYTSLSKAKKPDKYPQVVIEKKTRAEVLEMILKAFGLVYDEENDAVLVSGKDPTAYMPGDVMHYVMYYYSFFRKRVGMTWVRVIDKKQVLIDYRIDEHWKGTFEVIENYTFISAVKRGITTPVKKLICLFSGTEKYGRPILLGTYSTVKRDGFPAAGKVLFEKVNGKEEVLKRFRSEPHPAIVSYLSNSVFFSETVTPNSIDDIPENLLQEGKFHLGNIED